MTPVLAGIGFLPMTVLTFVASLALLRLLRTFGNGPVLVAAFLVIAVGLFWLAQAGTAGTYMTSVAAPMLLIGIGNGLGLGPLTGAAMRGVAPEDTGAASGLVNVAHQLGGTLGLAALITVFAAAMKGISAPDEALARGVSAGLHGSAVLAVLGLILSLALIIPSEIRRS